MLGISNDIELRAGYQSCIRRLGKTCSAGSAHQPNNWPNMWSLRSAVAALVMALTVNGIASAEALPADLLRTAFGANDPMQVTKIVVARVDPWIDRVLSASPNSFEIGDSKGDRQAIIYDHPGIKEVEEAVARTNLFSISNSCGSAKATAKWMYVAWAVTFYVNESKVAAVYLDRTGLCASTGTQLYEVNPTELAIYLRRTFSFMNY